MLMNSFNHLCIVVSVSLKNKLAMKTLVYKYCHVIVAFALTYHIVPHISSLPLPAKKDKSSIDITNGSLKRGVKLSFKIKMTRRLIEPCTKQRHEDKLNYTIPAAAEGVIAQKRNTNKSNTMYLLDSLIH